MRSSADISTGKKVAIVIFSVICIFLLCGVWVSDVFSSIFGVAFSEGYTLLALAKALAGMSAFSDSFVPIVLAGLFSLGALVTIILFIVTIITTITTSSARRIFTASSTTALLIAVVFYLFILFVNAEVTGGFDFDDFIFKPTLNPLLLIFFSVMIEVFSRSTNSPSSPSPSSAPASFFCTSCGAKIQTGSLFCPGCGKMIPPSSSSTFFEKEKKKTNDAKTLNSGGWKCSGCGRTNPAYTSTCACGKDKNETQY